MEQGGEGLSFCLKVRGLGYSGFQVTETIGMGRDRERDLPSGAVLPVARFPSQVHDSQDLNAHAVAKDHCIRKGLELALADPGLDLPVDV